MDNSDLTGEQPDFNTLPAWERVRILVAHPEHANKCDWKQMRKDLNGHNWTLLLSNQPQFAEHCRWTTLDGDNWTALLAAQPQFAEHCRWTKLDGGDWARLLAAQPQFADKCDWEAMEYDDWARLLAAQPQFADKCDWEAMGELWYRDWIDLLAAQPQFADKCDFSKWSGYAVAVFLSKMPQFADKCDFSKLDGHDWALLLAVQPQFADRCNWAKLSLENVSKLLVAQPGLTALAKEKKGVNGRILYISVEPTVRPAEIGFMELTQYRRNFGNLQDEIEDYGRIEGVPIDIEFGSSAYYMVLGESDEAGKWRWNGVELTVRLDGKVILEETVSPEDFHGVRFEEGKSPLKFDFDGGKDEWLVGAARWRLLVWARCVKEVPDDFRFVAGKLTIPYFRVPLDYGAEPAAVVDDADIRYEGFDREDFDSDWEADCEKDRTYLLLTRDGMKPFPERMTGWDWATLLRHSPQFANQCNWGKLEGGDWPLLLSARPEFADKCHCWDKFSKYSSWNWARLLETQPQLADKCHCWEEFSDKEWDKLVEKQPQLAKYRETP